MGHPERCQLRCYSLRMKYRNTKTGAVIDIKCQISGAWEPVEEPQAQAPTEKPKKAPAQTKKGAKK